MDSRIDLTDLTFCILIRIESAYRRRNFATVLKYLNKYVDTNYVIFEADKKRIFYNDLCVKKMKYFFIKDENSILHRTKYLNQMLAIVETPYAAIWDADAIAPITQIEKAFFALKNSSNVLVYPFSGIFFSLNDNISELFSLTLDTKIIDSPYMPKSLLNGFYSVGGAFMVHVSEYLKVGGENEHFYGWGPEDAERSARLQILNVPIERIDGSLYHLFHTRGINSKDSSDEGAIRNKKEFCKICSMTRNELINYIYTWDWVGDKYYPSLK